MYDAINQALVFTNTVCESGSNLPDSLLSLDCIQVDDELIDLAARRINWCLKSDGILIRLPVERTWPHLDQKLPRQWGIPLNRREHNVLKTFHDLTEMFIAKNYGFIETHKISFPDCVLPLERDGRQIILDLECDFVTINTSQHASPLFSNTPLITLDKSLASIYPLTWPSAFHETNFYPTDFSFQIPVSTSIQSIYLSQNELKDLNNDNFVGRALLFCYGFAVAQARQQYGEGVANKELADPIPIQCVYINPKDFTLGFVCFQLNTTSFDSPLKNQVWIDGPYPYTDYKSILKRMVSLQINGYFDNITNKLKNSLSHSS